MHWFLVRTKTHGERVGELNLRKLGFDTLCPYLKQEKIIRRKSQIVTNPLFPGYLFAKFDAGTHFRAVHYATGIHGVVRFGASLAQVEDSMIDTIRGRIHQGYVNAPKTFPFKPGEIVRIQDGPFLGLEAVFERELSDRQRVALLLNAVALKARVVVPLDQVRHF